VTGEGVPPSRGATRTEEDVAAPRAPTMAPAPEAPWLLMVAQLNSHPAETCGRLVARGCRIEEEGGEQEKRGGCKSMPTRAEGLGDVSPRRRWLSTPPQPSWLNPIERWCSILGRRVLHRGNCLSVEDVRERLLTVINSVNRTMAQPFKGTYTGRPLTA
jgi:hypothetical protein